jgi:mRNA interferase MazF
VNLFSGDVVWADLGPARGREQDGRRPLVIVASDNYLEVVDTLVIGLPVTSRERGWPNHVPLTGPTGLERPSFAMTEQILTVSRERIRAIAGRIDAESLGAVQVYLRDFLGL